jgi:hypothetical protein
MLYLSFILSLQDKSKYWHLQYVSHLITYSGYFYRFFFYKRFVKPVENWKRREKYQSELLKENIFLSTS